jgi:CheY-like chemotaxis protein
VPLVSFLGGDKNSQPPGWDGVISAPLTRRLLQVLAPPSPPEAAVETPVESLRVLIADDNSINQKILVRILERLGHHTCVCNDGLEAVEAYQKAEFDLILMDCMMPNLDGFEATKILRDGGCRLPIVAITANAIQGEREYCLAAGMDDYLSKPVNFAELNRILNQCRSQPDNCPIPLAQANSHENGHYELIIDCLSQGLKEMFGDGTHVERQVSRAQPWPSFRENLMAWISFDSPTFTGQIIIGCDHKTASQLLEPLLPGVDLNADMLCSGISELLNAVSCSLAQSELDPSFGRIEVAPPTSWSGSGHAPALSLTPGQESVLMTNAGALLLFICFSDKSAL